MVWTHMLYRIKCPYKTKKQFVDWLVNYKGWKVSHARKLHIKQMYAIYYKS